MGSQTYSNVGIVASRQSKIRYESIAVMVNRPYETGALFPKVKGKSLPDWAADLDIAVGWTYPDPMPAFEAIRGWFCFYPGRVRCFLGGEEVRPQSGPFYGGWVTDAIVGPYKGEPGTRGW